MTFAWVITIACAYSLFTITQAGNYTTVEVGKNGKLAFDPPFVSDFVGATLVEPSLGIWAGGLMFHSYKANPPHNITESTFEQPCDLIRPGGISLPGEAKDPFAELGVLINGSEQRWFHVATASRCAKGMVFAINPTWPQTYEAFRAKAMGGNDSSSTGSPNSTSLSVTTISTSVRKFAATFAGVIFLIHLLL